MKKLFVLLLSLALFITGCKKDALTGYLIALEETGKVTSGHNQIEISLYLNFNTENKSSEEILELKKYEHVKITNSGLGEKQEMEFPEITEEQLFEGGIESLWSF